MDDKTKKYALYYLNNPEQLKAKNLSNGELIIAISCIAKIKGLEHDPKFKRFIIRLMNDSKKTVQLTQKILDLENSFDIIQEH